ncbi:hypothetical protein ABK040_008055 [Willaertia magna]
MNIPPSSPLLMFGGPTNVPPSNVLPSTPISLSKEYLHFSAKLVDQNQARDSQLVDLDQLSKPQNDSFDDIFIKKQFAVLPDPLFEQYNKLEYKCFMGIFSEIHRAWVTIDNKFFMWSYLDGSEFNEYDELDQVIISAALVKPKVGVFKDFVKYLLVLATPVEVVLIAIGFNNQRPSNISLINNNSSIYQSNIENKFPTEMELFPTNYAVSTDNVNILKIIGTKNGRIFMCGKDGCLYELTYDSQDSWFKSKCRKLNHSQSVVGVLVPSFLKFTNEDPIIDIVVDDSRNILYTLSENMTFEVYDLGKDGYGMTKIATYSNLIVDSIRKFPNLNRDFKNIKIISIQPITMEESKAIHLVAVSSKGDRFFFSTNIEGGRPIGLSLIHIKALPPLSVTGGIGNSPNISPYIRSPVGLGQNVIKGIHECFYKNGVFLMADSRSDEVDNLICISLERKCDPTLGITGYNTRPNILCENVSTRDLEGKSHAISEIPLYLDPLLIPTSNPLNELSIQHIKPPREFVCLSNNGIHLLVKLRPIDLLQQILQQSQSEKLLQKFFYTYGFDESCSMCVLLASSPPQYNTVISQDSQKFINLYDEQLIKKAEEAFFKYGGEPRFEAPTYVDHRQFATVEDIMGGPVTSPDISYSSQHNGLYLYFSRIIRPLWKSPLVNSVRINENERQVVSTRFTVKQLKYLQQCAQGLLLFMERFPHLYQIHAGQHKSLQDKVFHLYHIKKDEEAKKLEQRSLSNLHRLVKRCYQGLLFLEIVTKHDVGRMLKEVPSKRVGRLASMTFRDFILLEEGEEMMRDLVRLIIARGEPVELVCNSLKVCDIFFNEHDLEEYKALHTLERAKLAYNKEELLDDALSMYKKIAGTINVLVVCKEFQRYGYHTGAVDLALTSAELKDPKNLAIEWVKAGRPANDIQGQLAYTARMDCYHSALNVLEEFIYNRTPQVSTSVSGFLPTTAMQQSQKQKGLSPQDREKQFNSLLNRMKQSRDSLFHETLYKWLLDHHMNDKILDMSTPYIENFLLKQTSDFNLLWQYYSKNQRYDKAAKVLERLAESKELPLTIDERIQYLSNAIGQAKAAQGQGELLSSLTDKLDVARIQKRVIIELNEKKHKDRENAEKYNRMEKELNEGLYDLTTLYNQYAHPEELLESTLCILHCARYKDYRLIQSLWNNLIDIYSAHPNKLEEKIISLGRDLSGIYFPLEHVCGELEKRNLDHLTIQKPTNWVIRLMREKVKIPYIDLYNAYHNIFILVFQPTTTEDDDELNMFSQENYEGLPRTPNFKLRILENIAEILRDWIDEIKNQSFGLSTQQTFSLVDIQRDIDDYLSALNQFTNDNAASIKERFNIIKRTI